MTTIFATLECYVSTLHECCILQDTEDKEQLEEKTAKMKITEEKLRNEAEVDTSQITRY